MHRFDVITPGFLQLSNTEEPAPSPNTATRHTLLVGKTAGLLRAHDRVAVRDLRPWREPIAGVATVLDVAVVTSDEGNPTEHIDVHTLEHGVFTVPRSRLLVVQRVQRTPDHHASRA